MNSRARPPKSPDQAAGTRSAEVQNLLDDATARDDQADVRDTIAAKRDDAADLAAFMDPDADHAIVVRTRRAAAHDRNDSKRDRRSAAADRAKLAPDHPQNAQNPEP